MLSHVITRSWRVPLIGFAALVLLAGTFAAGLFINQASAQPEVEVIHACVGDRSGSARIVAEDEECLRGEHRLSWNVEGPAGPAGLSDYQRIVIPYDQDVEIGFVYPATMTCPSGSNVLSGGISVSYLELLAAIEVFYSYPDSASSWSLTFELNVLGGNETVLPAGSIDLYIVCAVVAP